MGLDLIGLAKAFQTVQGNWERLEKSSKENQMLQFEMMKSAPEGFGVEFAQGPFGPEPRMKYLGMSDPRIQAKLAMEKQANELALRRAMALNAMDNETRMKQDADRRQIDYRDQVLRLMGEYDAMRQAGGSPSGIEALQPLNQIRQLLRVIKDPVPGFAAFVSNLPAGQASMFTSPAEVGPVHADQGQRLMPPVSVPGAGTQVGSSNLPTPSQQGTAQAPGTVSKQPLNMQTLYNQYFDMYRAQGREIGDATRLAASMAESEIQAERMAADEARQARLDAQREQQFQAELARNERLAPVEAVEVEKALEELALTAQTKLTTEIQRTYAVMPPRDPIFGEKLHQPLQGFQVKIKETETAGRRGTQRTEEYVPVGPDEPADRYQVKFGKRDLFGDADMAGAILEAVDKLVPDSDLLSDDQRAEVADKLLAAFPNVMDSLKQRLQDFGMKVEDNTLVLQADGLWDITTPDGELVTGFVQKNASKMKQAHRSTLTAKGIDTLVTLFEKMSGRSFDAVRVDVRTTGDQRRMATETGQVSMPVGGTRSPVVEAISLFGPRMIVPTPDVVNAPRQFGRGTTVPPSVNTWWIRR